MRVARQTIKNILKEAESKFNLPEDVLIKIYDAEARVVFLGLRRGITNDLRRIIRVASEEKR